MRAAIDTYEVTTGLAVTIPALLRGSVSPSAKGVAFLLAIEAPDQASGRILTLGALF